MVIVRLVMLGMCCSCVISLVSLGCSKGLLLVRCSLFMLSEVVR